MGVMESNDVIAQITNALTPLVEENAQLRESVAEVRAMFEREDSGWSLVFGLASGDREEGLSLDEVKSVSKLARVQAAAGALPKRAADLHAGYVFGGNIEFEGTLRTPGKKGPGSGLVAFYENPVNQDNLFSGAAKRSLQYARFTDGNVVVFCNTTTKEARRIPLHEISGVYVNPDYADEVWAWLRTWTHIGLDGKPVEKKMWVYTNRFQGRRRTFIPVGNEDIPVAGDMTAVDLRANRQVGWLFGVPDATSGLHWTKAYGEVLRYGSIVSEALAKIVYKVVSKSTTGAKQVGVRMNNAGYGGTAVIGAGQDISLVSQSRQTYDFTAARPLAAMAAAAWNITVPDLLADSSAAGSSYGSLNALTPGMQNAMMQMRVEWEQLYQDVFNVMGFGVVGIHWPPMNEPDTYRLAQELTLYAPALTDEEYRALVLDRLDIVGDPKKIPPTLKSRTDSAKQAASPDQGRSNGTGGASSGDKNDLRDDTIS